MGASTRGERHSYPIVEFDDGLPAMIEPSEHIRKVDVAECCLICFFQETIDKVAKEQAARTVVAGKWEDGPHPIYEIVHQGRRLAFFHPGVGSAHCVGLLEEAIAYGIRKFIACGGCGALDKSVALGHIVCVSAAVRDEGASYHYAPPSREISANPEALKVLTGLLVERNLPHVVGKTWSTDAPYRETPSTVARRRAEGCIVVDMEAAGMIAAAQFRRVAFAQAMYGGDDLSGEKWDSRNWDSQASVRENLFWTCADAALRM